MSEHTKGQWTAKYDSTGGNSVFILSNDNGAFAHYSCWRRNNGEPFKPHPEDEANAALIAASPMLYDLVKRASSFLEMNDTQRVSLVKECKSMLDSLHTIK